MKIIHTHPAESLAHDDQLRIIYTDCLRALQQHRRQHPSPPQEIMPGR